MSSDWSLVEYRPGRYVKVAPSGDFLGRASRAEVRDWFEAQREGRNPQPGPEKQDALGVLEDAFTLFSQPGDQTREAEPPEAEQDALGVLEQALSVFSPMGEGAPEPEPPAEPDVMGILEDAYSLVAPDAESVQPEVTREPSSAEPDPIAPQPVQLDQEPEEPQVSVLLPGGGASNLDPETEAIQAEDLREPKPPESEVPSLDVDAEDPMVPQAAVPEPAAPEAIRSETQTRVSRPEKPNNSQAIASHSHSLDLEVGEPEIKEPPAPQDAEPDLAALDQHVEEYEPEPPRKSPEAEPEPQLEDVEDLDDAEIEEEMSHPSLEAEIEYLDPDPDDLLEEEMPASLSATGSGPSQRLVAPVPSQAPPPENQSLDSEALDNGVGRWLWVDPRHEVGYRSAGFDLAGFLQRAVDLFQSKTWTGGRRPGRLAVHPDDAGDELRQAAEELGLEIVPNLQVGLGTYRLALAEPPADTKPQT